MDSTTQPTSPVWTDGLGLTRVLTAAGPVAVLWRDGDPQAHLALVGGQTFDDLPALIEAASGDPATILAGACVDAARDRILSPVGRPGKIICIGQNYLDHVREGGRQDGPAYPDLFAKWHTCLAAPFGEVPLPPESDQVDYESELAVVIGARARRVPAEGAGSVIFGYTAANDGSVRDFQFHTAQRTAGKAWDGLTPLGPVVVPAVQLGGSRPDLAITGLLDGQVMQDDRTSSLLFGIPELISYITTVMTLEPGDLILTGTPSGVGFVRDPKVLLRHGDEFEVRIEGVGSLRNRFVDEKSR
ncbi:hypothetical protein CcI49_11445 [Frankia sp. CcI49]|uniref:fumarylacetoacetate hydrolase family protein n=1 Tax=Frankia sp. CcI49 TaxID=1745382 RepID=UPI0009786F63|nr:fumarylacetoacetate hydrolase family protein [Frankia sp. CcI49]ONH60440.1 hypothetical protein CcI49_11445 [Frankia sp. CcI49]